MKMKIIVLLIALFTIVALGGYGNNRFTPFSIDVFVAVNPADLADGAGETISVNVPGAALGDFVVAAAPYDLQDLIVTAYVQAANTVEIRIQNENAGSNVNLANGTWKFRVLK